MTAIGIMIIGVLVVGFAVGFDSEPSAEPVAQSFLLDWQQQDYMAAGALTTAAPGTVAAALRDTVRQLDATALFLSMGPVVQHGARATASFTASFDLAEQGRVWQYAGRFGLHERDGGWVVDWAPSDINPLLGPGDRLAVLTSFPARGLVLDNAGRPLQMPSTVYEVGVVPAMLASAAVTSSGFARVTGVDPGQVLGQIEAAPPGQFLKLASLDPVTYARMRARLGEVRGLIVRRTRGVLFKADATGLVGNVGSEIDPQLRTDGAFYLPGTTVGTSGLESAYQRSLLGTPATSVVVINAAGQQLHVLMNWAGTPGTAVRTTIDSRVQSAAIDGLSTMPAADSGEIVAVQASTGRIVAVAQHQGKAALPPGGLLDARLTPGTAFTIVSAAALLDSGLALDTPSPCTDSFSVGGRTFSSSGTGTQRPFSADFADGCGTAFAGLSERLRPEQFTEVVQDFGIGDPSWQLPVRAFSGSVVPATGQAELAAETIGAGNVTMSPLAMAMIAAAIDSGATREPSVLINPADPAGLTAAAAAPGKPLDADLLTALRSLLRGAVRSGAAHAASAHGGAVSGQVGLTRQNGEWISWFVGYRGDIALCAIETGRTPRLSAAALTSAFLSDLS